MKKKVAFLGPHGTYTEEAAQGLLKDKQQVDLMPYQSISDCLWATEEEQVHACVVPIENSIEGSVLLTLDMLVHEVNLPIQAEITVPISHALYAKEHTNLDKIEKVYSHPQAIAQCRTYLRQALPQADIIETRSTAGACQFVCEAEERNIAAIGPPLIKTIYGLDVLAQGIQDYENNFTRFVLCGNDVELREADQYKASLLITLPHDYQGALYQVLAAFAWRKLNLTRIESRPTKKKLGNYHFFIDVEQPSESVLLSGALEEIEALGCQVRSLGSYPAFVNASPISL